MLRTAIIADDDEFFRLALAALLSRNLDFTRVIETMSLDEALARLSECPEADLALFDLKMPGMESAASIGAVRECFPTVKAVVVSASSDRRDVLLALEAGAHGYVPKTASAAELVRALGMILDGGIYVPSFLADVAKSEATPSCVARRESAGSDVSLTRRQRDVLALIVEGRSNKEIALALDLSEGTVKVHVAALLRLLGVSNRSGAAVVGLRILQ